MMAATLAAGLLFSWLALEIVTVKVQRDFAETVKPLVESLPAKVTVKPNRQQIKNDLNRLSRNPEIVMSAVVSCDGKVVFARGAQKHEYVIWPLHVTYPLVREGARVACLKVWPSPEFFYRKIAHDMPAVALALAAAFLLCVTLPWYFFSRYYLVVPLSRLRKFVDRIETDGGGALEFGAASGQWHSLSLKMNRLKERIEDISATQNMLFSVSQTLTSHVDVSELCNVILDIVQKKFGDTPCAILMLGEDGFFAPHELPRVFSRFRTVHTPAARRRSRGQGLPEMPDRRHERYLGSRPADKALPRKRGPRFLHTYPAFDGIALHRPP
jgi:hypothetical protein